MAVKKKPDVWIVLALSYDGNEEHITKYYFPTEKKALAAADDLHRKGCFTSIAHGANIKPL